MVSHPKIAHLRPEMEWKKAVADLNEARVELQAATNQLRTCERMEGEAMAALIAAMPPPSADEVNRDRLAKETARKMARVSKGLPAEEPKPLTIGRTPLDQVFAARAKGNMNRRANHFPPIRPPMFKV